MAYSVDVFVEEFRCMVRIDEAHSPQQLTKPRKTRGVREGPAESNAPTPDLFRRRRVEPKCRPPRGLRLYHMLWDGVQSGAHCASMTANTEQAVLRTRPGHARLLPTTRLRDGSTAANKVVGAGFHVWQNK